MARFDVIDLNRKKVSEIDLADEVFAADANPALVYEVVKAQQVSRRAGTVAVKNRSLVSGGGRKPYRQKGTGQARQGSIRASHWVGGGKAMGPKPRDYSYRPPRSVRRGGLRTVLSMRARDSQMLILDMFPSDGKSKAAFTALTKSLKLKDALVVDAAENQGLFLAVRNLERFDALPVQGLNAESVLRRKTLVLTATAARAIDEALRGPLGKRRKAEG